MTEETGYLDGQLLIAMPTMTDPRFERTVIYLCAHSENGAMGIVINKPLTSITFAELVQQLGIEDPVQQGGFPVQFGGPVETGRGFVLHSTDYGQDGTVQMAEEICLTATIDILKAIADGKGPERAILALGYAGWAPGQLESEIQANGWLHCESDAGLVFGDNLGEKWPAAVGKLGFDPSLLSMDAGHA